MPLDPQGWINRAGTIVGCDFAKGGWERVVHGDEPLQSAYNYRPTTPDLVSDTKSGASEQASVGLTIRIRCQTPREGSGGRG